MKNVGFGFGQILSTPPKWLVIVIAVAYIDMFAAQQIITGDPLMADIKKLQYINYLSNSQAALLALAALVGVKPKKEDDNE